MFSDAISLSYDYEILGNMSQFQAGNVKIRKEIDLELIDEIEKLSTKDNISTIKVNPKVLSKYQRKFELDHGTMVPLYFIEKEYSNYKIVHITYGMMKDIDLFRFGVKISEAISNLNRQAVIIASGDLSHRLTEDGPYPFSPKGKEFDETLISCLKKGDTIGVYNIDKKVVEEAGECGMRSIYILLGTLKSEFSGELLSYQGPFGVGYGVMKFVPKISDKDYQSILISIEEQRRNEKLQNSDQYVKLARASLEYYFKNQEIMDVTDDLSEELLNQKAGVFVSLKKYGKLRGCVGTFLPATSSLAKEIIRNAIEAAFEDPRFNQLSSVELDEIDISVDVLSKPTKANKDELDPKIYGVIVSSGHKKGLLLPDINGIDTVEEQLNIACEKAGISFRSNYNIEKFTVTRHFEGTKHD